MPEETLDIAIIGGGVMGLFTAHQASTFTNKVAIIERSTFRDPMQASFGYTRTFRNDYLDPEYTRLAYEAQRLWAEFEQQAGRELLVRCGCLNVTVDSVSPFAGSYAQQTHDILSGGRYPTEEFDRNALAKRFPQVSADYARLNIDGGIADLYSIADALEKTLTNAGIVVRDNTTVQRITQQNGEYEIVTTAGTIKARSVVVTSGHGTNDVLSVIDGCDLRVSLTPDKPKENKYVIPSQEQWQKYLPANFPVVAYLDVGIYVHPILEGRTPGIKVGYYNPPDVTEVNSKIDGVVSFVNECLPELADAEMRDVTGIDQCEYDLTNDDEFILGPVPGMPRMYIGVGWRGTGYKFSPWVGRALSQLALTDGTVYDISRFNPGRGNI